jgi:hypothetical protein
MAPPWSGWADCYQQSDQPDHQQTGDLPMADTNSNLPVPIPTPLNVSALARQHGVSRRTIARRLQKGWAPSVSTQTAIDPKNLDPIDVAYKCAPPGRKPGRKMGGVLIILAVAIAGLALIINGQTGFSYGTTPLAAGTFAGLSIAADLLAIVLPSAAVALWWNCRRILSASAWVVWGLAASMAMLASLGFASLHLGDTAAGRAAIVTTATAASDQRSSAIEAARAAAQAATLARQGECQKRGPLCRDLEHVEQARMSDLAAAIALPVPTAVTIADPDPQVTGAVRLAQWVGLGVTPMDVGNLRLALMALLPNLAGLVLSFGLALRR